MGVVYKARDCTLNRIVALKMILSGKSASDVAVQRFKKEALAIAKFDHPNIVPIYDIGEEEGNHYFAMAFIEGGTLKSLVAERGPQKVEQALALMIPIVEAMAFAHQHSIIHRDLKPDNVMLDSQGRPRITDFGLAKGTGEGDPNLTAAGQILGTPAYMAPEQALGGDRKIGPEADIYALGGILHFLLTGAPPFTGATMTEVLSKVITQAPSRPSLTNTAVPVELDEIVHRCLEKDVAKRYSSAADLARDLKKLTGAQTMGGATVTKIAERKLALAKRGSGVGLLVAAVVVILLAVGAYFGYQAYRASPSRNPVNPTPGGDVAYLQLVDGKKNDFGLKATMVGSAPGENLSRKLNEDDPISFQVEVEKDAYIGIWSIESDGTITQLFPNDYDSDQLFHAGQPRTIPSKENAKKYSINATVSKGVDEVRVVASTQKWTPIAGKKDPDTPFMVFRSKQEREEWNSQRRGLVLKNAPKGAPAVASVAEGLLKYQVFPKAK